MRKYDYVIVSGEDRGVSELQDVLDQNGLQGYRVVGILQPNERIIMEREQGDW